MTLVRRSSVFALVLAALLSAPHAGAVTVAGGGPASSDCYVGFTVDADHPLTASGTKVEGKACGGSCVFRVRACSQVTIAGSTCVPPTLTAVKASGGLAQPPLDAPGCGAATTVTLAPKGKHAKKQKLSLSATASAKPKKDKDKLVLVCDPNPTDDGCSAAATCTPPPGSRTLTLGAGTSATTGSHIFAIGGVDAANPGTQSGSLVLVKGATSADGTADLTIGCDSVIGFQAINGSYTCLKTDAAGSSGKIDCDGGTPVDVVVSGDSHGTGPNDPPVSQIGGTTARAGDGYVMANSRFVVCPDDGPDGGCIGDLASSADCSDATKVDFSKAKILLTGGVATTGQATSTILNPNGAANLSAPVTETGQPFSCASFATPGSGGILEMPVFLYDFPLVQADVTAVLQVGE